MRAEIQVANKDVKPGDKVYVDGEFREVARTVKEKTKSRLAKAGWVCVNHVKIKTYPGEVVPEKTGYKYGDGEADNLVTVRREVAP